MHPARHKGGDTIIPDHGQIIPETAHGIRQKRFGAQTQDEGLHALFQQPDVHTAVVHLGLDLAVHTDRTGDQLGEHTQINAQIQQLLAGRVLFWYTSMR